MGGPALNILVVEDERIISLALSSLLSRLGHRVVACVPSGEEALRTLKQTRADLVLMDIRLEGRLDGIDTALAIREMDGPPVAFTSAYTDADTMARADAAGPLDFVAKPVSPADIVRLVESIAHGGAGRPGEG